MFVECDVIRGTLAALLLLSKVIQATAVERNESSAKRTIETDVCDFRSANPLCLTKMTMMPNLLQLGCKLLSAEHVNQAGCDGVILISHSLDAVNKYEQLRPLYSALQNYISLNNGAKSDVTLIAVDKTVLPSQRLIYAGTGPVNRDHDDVRTYGNVAEKAMKLALKAGMKSALFATVPNEKYPEAEVVAALGALQVLYVPLNIREEENITKAANLTLLSLSKDSEVMRKSVEAIEMARIVSRDIGDADPERMTPERVADYVKHVFEGSSVKINITSDESVIGKEFPLMAAVNRAASEVKGHKPRLIWLEYIPEGPIEETLMLVGKGVTIDTGGADVKTNGHMFGMCRDKYGSAIVAGFFRALDILRPKGIKVVGYMAMVRNSIGSHSYTTDEIIRARSGKRIHIYNTDAEGRIAMLDPLTKMRELAIGEKNPHLFTIATLTGHEVMSYGLVSALMDNGPARASRHAEKFQNFADDFGQPVEISRLHKEDFDFMDAECECADVRQGNTKPSVQTVRGHQSPAAFLIKASRLDEHGTDSSHPIKFTHVDMGSAMGDHPEISRPNPLVAFISRYILTRNGYFDSH